MRRGPVDLRVSQQAIKRPVFFYDLTQLILSCQNILDIQSVVISIQLKENVYQQAMFITQTIFILRMSA